MKIKASHFVVEFTEEEWHKLEFDLLQFIQYPADPTTSVWEECSQLVQKLQSIGEEFAKANETPTN